MALKPIDNFIPNAELSQRVAAVMGNDPIASLDAASVIAFAKRVTRAKNFSALSKEDKKMIRDAEKGAPPVLFTIPPDPLDAKLP